MFILILQQIIQSWNPDKEEDEAAVFLEDDIEVSPYFFHYVMWCARFYEMRGSGDRGLVGFSLYTPRVDETTLTSNPEDVIPWRPSSILGASRIFLSQIPCSWGAIFLPNHWRRFQRYYSARREHRAEAFPLSLQLKSDTWEKSWKKFLIEYMALGGYYMMYPNFPHEASLSTNHYEVGVHSFAAWHEPVITNILREDPDERFRVPLLQDTAPFRQLPITPAEISEYVLPVVNLHHKLSSLAELQRTAQDYQKFLQKEIPTFPLFVNIVI